MIDRPEDFWLQAWKRQLDAGFGVLEAIVEGATRIREIQLEAAAEAHADAEATRKAVAAARDLAHLARLQADWARANAAKSAAYWRSVCQAVMETDVALMKCGAVPVAVPAGLKGADLEASKQALLGIVDSAFKQWLDAAQRLYRPAEKETA